MEGSDRAVKSKMSVLNVSRVAVIGAGASGLPTIKACLEAGLDPVCFERSDDLGGLWYYKDQCSEDGYGMVMRSTVINTSKEMMSYSDFPPPPHFANFMHNTYVRKYLEMYADQFYLRKHIQFNTQVLRVYRTEDFTMTGQWYVHVKDRITNIEEVQIYDAVILCTGHHGVKHIPTFTGAGDFTGKTFHTHDYRAPHQYEDKTVLVVGIGNSGGDLATELSRIAKKVYISTRRGSWVVNRIADAGYPIDYLFNRRFVSFLAECLPSLVNLIMEHRCNSRFDHANYGLLPKHRFNQQHPMINDDLPNRIACGSLIVKPDIKRMTSHGVEFVDGSHVENVDAIAYATGYKFGFPYLEEGIVQVKDNHINLYKYIFPPDLAHSTLAVIGCFQPLGAIQPIAELQSRWVAKVLKGDAPLPKAESMLADIQKKRDDMAARYVPSQRHTIQVDFIPYCDELAEQVGCKPSLGALCLTDPKLAYHCVFGPCTPYQYRLKGPNSWPPARETILNTIERTLCPTRTRAVALPQSMFWNYVAIVAMIALMAAIVKFYFT